MKNFLKIEDLTKSELNLIFEETDKIIKDKKYLKYFENLSAITFFSEPSTRTRLSFERACRYLNIDISSVADASFSSSLKKGESFKDTFRTLSQYSDLIIFRHPDEKWVDFAKYSRVPVINAGNGSLEHPTQALLDLYTIKSELGSIENKNVLICGDLKLGRTVHSLIKVLSQNNCNILTCPSVFKNDDKAEGFVLDLPSIYGDYPKIKINEVVDYLKNIDVLYMTRTQKERIDEYIYKSFEFFKLDSKTINSLKEKCIILHPLPRNEEISEEIDDDPRAIYHEKQIKNGLYTRISLIKHLLQP